MKRCSECDKSVEEGGYVTFGSRASDEDWDGGGVIYEIICKECWDA